jgi:hypothetical protein
MRKIMIKSIAALCACIALGAVMLLAAEENAIYNELVNQGVKLSNGKTITLPKPVMADGLTAEAQKKVLEDVGPKNNKDNLQRFLRGRPTDWFEIKQTSEEGGTPQASIGRRVDLYFVAQGKLSTVASDGFMQEQLKAKKKAETDAASEDQSDAAKGSKDAKDAKGKAADEKKGPQEKLEFYTEEELKKRKLSVNDTNTKKERFAHAVLTPDDLFGKVQVTCSGYGIETRNPESVVVGFKLDPRFDKDPDYPNQYQTAKTDPNGKVVLGPVKPYMGFGGYSKITKLQGPDEKVFVEYHLVYDEPFEWFNGTAELASKLETSYNDNIKKFRRNIIEYEKKHPSGGVSSKSTAK